MNNVMEKIYLMYYFLIRKDKVFSKKGRALVLLEMVFTMIFVALLCVLYGLLNIRTNTFISAGGLGLLAVLMSYLFGKTFYSNKERDVQMIKNGKKYSNKSRKILMIIGALSIPVTFVIMVFGALFMGYLWSLHQ